MGDIVEMKVLCIVALVIACSGAYAGPRPRPIQREVAQFGITDALLDAVKGKIIDIVKDQLTKETVDKLVEIIKDKVDGGPWVDTIIDFIGDRISQALLNQIIDYIENNLLAYNIAEYGAKENFLEGLKKFLEMLPDNILEDIIDKILEGNTYTSYAVARYDLKEDIMDALGGDLLEEIKKILDMINEENLKEMIEKSWSCCNKRY